MFEDYPPPPCEEARQQFSLANLSADRRKQKLAKQIIFISVEQNCWKIIHSAPHPQPFCDRED